MKKRIFISYSHKDEPWKERLETHLKVLNQHLDPWDDRRIQAGGNWYDEIKEAINTADAAVILVSADFLTSRFILEEEIPALFTRREKEKMPIFPLIVCDCAWQQLGWLSSVQARPKDGLPLEGKKKHTVNKILSDFVVEIKTILEQTPTRETVMAGQVPDGSTKPGKVFLSKLPAGGRVFLGRETELAMLDDAWEDAHTHVLTLVAWGGVGKTALVNEWLNGMEKDGFRGAARVYGWSFYSQGASVDRQTSAEPFIDHALGWFGDPDPTAGSAWDKGTRLANRVRETKTLLVLDGIEPLQYPPGEMQGHVKDPALESLLKGLARSQPGLCVVTTRVRVEGIEFGADSPVRQECLEQLPPETGAALLKSHGVKGTDAELAAVSTEFKGHALALNLLGRYLAVVHKGDIRKKDRVPGLTAEEKEGGHAKRVMASYEKWLGKDKSEIRSTKSETNPNDQNTNDQNKKPQTDVSKQTVSDFEHSNFEFVSDFGFRASDLNSPELIILYMLGLFDRPAGAGAMDALRAEPAIEGLTTGVQGLSEADWRYALTHLRDLNLLAVEEGGDEEEGRDVLDCHPLVREYFGERFQGNHPDSRKEAHGRLYEYYKGLPKEKPDTLREMEPLYIAVFHGCRAGRYKDVLYDVYWERILRKDEFFNTKKLGAFGSNLSALSGFFDVPWSQPSTRLTEEDQGFILNEAAFCLRALGRLREAAQPMEAAVQAVEKQKNWLDAAKGATNLSELCLTLGEVSRAKEWARKSVASADKSGDAFMQYASRATLADALHQSGAGGSEKTAEAAEVWTLFREAEERQKKRQPEYPFLYSLPGFRYCDLLLGHGGPGPGAPGEPATPGGRGGRYREVQKRTNETIKIAERNNWLLEIALDNLSLGRAHWLQALAESPPDSTAFTVPLAYLDRAVDGLREAGTQDHLPRALFARAAVYRCMKDVSRARDDLEEAREIAERGSMGLHMADYHLESARLNRDQGNTETAKTHLETAKKMIDKMGYHRRDAEVEELECLK